MKNIFKTASYVLVFVLVYLFTLLMLSKLKIGGAPLLQTITKYNIDAGGWGQTLKRFREIENIKNIDILFLGSSHTYRGFDPRVFATHGYTSFNMGSSGQTPLNTYYLLSKYFKQLHPKLVVFEIYPLLLSKDGIESYYDLVTNLPFSYELAEMAFAVKNPHTIHVLVKSILARLKSPLDSVNQSEILNETYVAGGYCESNLTINNSKFSKSIDSITISKIQIQYLHRILKHVLDSQVKILIVTQPMPLELLQKISNYGDVTSIISKIAKEHNVMYIDYNMAVKFDTSKDFYDNDHLTSSGVVKFNKLLLKDLLNNKLL